MAGAGFKTFNTGDVLTASDVNTYLMQQTTMVFADASARSTALGANVAEGMISYLKDTNAVERYDGSSWGAIGAGDIEGVTAGAGLSGGGTSGTVTLNLASTAAGRNAMINGGFDIWQRGTSFTTNGGTYCADRWRIGGSGTAPTVSRETFTLGAAPVAGYESPYFLRWNQSSAATDVQTLANRMEDVRTFAGQSVVLSFWARINSGTAAPAIYLQQVFGTGGSPSTAVTTTVAASQTFTSSWVRYSFAVSVPSISGKTIGTNNDSYLQMYFQFPTSGTWQIDLWGFQLELGSSATPFSRAGGTIQGELAACQRYFQIIGNGANFAPIGTGSYYTTTDCYVAFALKTTMRTAPSATFSGGATGATVYVAGNGRVSTATATAVASVDFYEAKITTAADTAGRGADVYINQNATLSLSSEL